MHDLRRRILDASVELVAEQGVRAMSFREVARRAGVSHQAPYHHFKSDHGILHEIAREGFRALTHAMKSAAEKAGPEPLDALDEAGVAYVLFAREHLGHFRVMFQRSFIEVVEPATPLAEAVETHQLLVSLCAAVHRAGLGRGLSAEALTNVSWSLVHGLATLMAEQILQQPQAGSRKANPAKLVRETVGAMKRLLAPPVRRRAL